MVDTLSKSERSERMSRVRSKDTRPELAIRKLVYALGYRYRLHGTGLPGRPDLVFRSRQKAIFVHGCFWHRHTDSHCRLARLPKSRVGFWLEKLEGNRVRDARNLRKLRTMGWKCLVVWECQTKDAERLRRRVASFLAGLDR